MNNDEYLLVVLAGAIAAMDEEGVQLSQPVQFRPRVYSGGGETPAPAGLNAFQTDAFQNDAFE